MFRRSRPETPADVVVKAAWQERWGDVEEALRGGFEVGTWASDGSTLLHKVACRDHGPAVELVLSHGGDPDMKDATGCSATFQAAFFGNPHSLAALVAGGGDVNLRNNLGVTPLIAIAQYPQGNAEACVRVLLDEPSLHLQARLGGHTAEMLARSQGLLVLADMMAANVRGFGGGGGAGWVNGGRL